MGIIRRGILGGFSNKVGNIVGSTWKGIAIIKSLPLSVANPRTAGQVLQRGKFTQLTRVGSDLLAGIIKPMWDRFATGMSGYNAFISVNQSAFHVSGQLEVEKLQISRGRMLAPANVSMTGSGASRSVTVTHPANDRFALPTDRIAVVVIDSASKRVGYGQVTVSTRGSSASTSVTVTLPANYVIDGDACCIVGYLRADGSEVSNSKSFV